MRRWDARTWFDGLTTPREIEGLGWWEIHILALACSLSSRCRRVLTTRGKRDRRRRRNNHRREALYLIE